MRAGTPNGVQRFNYVVERGRGIPGRLLRRNRHQRRRRVRTGDAEPETPEELLLSQLGAHDFGARTFRIYAIDEGGVYDRAQFTADETAPGTVSAAAAERNACIAELFNCKLETDYAEDCTTYFENVRAEQLAGIMERTILAAGASVMGDLTTFGWLYDLREIENSICALDAPYWESAR